MKDRAKAKYNQVNEDDIANGYVRLLETLIFNAFEQIYIAPGWGIKRKLSARTINKKSTEMELVAKWLKSPGSDFWFGLYESCMFTDKGKTKRGFVNQLKKSRRRLKKLSTVST